MKFMLGRIARGRTKPSLFQLLQSEDEYLSTPKKVWQNIFHLPLGDLSGDKIVGSATTKDSPEQRTVGLNLYNLKSILLNSSKVILNIAFLLTIRLYHKQRDYSIVAKIKKHLARDAFSIKLS